VEAQESSSPSRPALGGAVLFAAPPRRGGAAGAEGAAARDRGALARAAGTLSSVSWAPQAEGPRLVSVAPHASCTGRPATLRRL